MLAKDQLHSKRNWKEAKLGQGRQHVVWFEGKIVRWKGLVVVGQVHGWLRHSGSEEGWQESNKGAVGEERVGKQVVEGSGSVGECESDEVVAGEEIAEVGLQDLMRFLDP